MKDDLDKWISVDNRTKNLVLRFWVKGIDKQFFISSGLKDTPRNREVVRLRRDAIATDIMLDRFDISLESYHFKSVKNSSKPLIITKKYEYGLKQLWNKYTDFKSALLERTSLINYKKTAAVIERLADDSLKKAPEIREWLLKNLSHGRAWETLMAFSACCNWAVDCGLIADNPFLKLKIPKPKKRSLDDDYKAFTLEQRDLIIESFEKHETYSHYAPLIKFLFWTGCRPGEAFALTWADITDNCTRIRIDKSYSQRIKKGTKNNKKRTFPTSEGSKLQSLLLEIKPPLKDYNPSKLVFTSKTRKQLSSKLVFFAWKDSYHKKEGKKYHYLGVVQELAAKGLVPYLKLYATRHTFITWAIAHGITPEKVALWVGDEVETILKFYVHPNVVGSECPDF